jgi:hypothetical protein
MGMLVASQYAIMDGELALRHRSSVKRIVITSTTGAVRSTLPEPKLFTEADFNEQAIQQVERDGRAADGMAKYQASKTLAEKGARYMALLCIRSNPESSHSGLGILQRAQILHSMGYGCPRPSLGVWCTSISPLVITRS